MLHRMASKSSTFSIDNLLALPRHRSANKNETVPAISVNRFLVPSFNNDERIDALSGDGKHLHQASSICLEAREKAGLQQIIFRPKRPGIEKHIPIFCDDELCQRRYALDHDGCYSTHDRVLRRQCHCQIETSRKSHSRGHRLHVSYAPQRLSEASMSLRSSRESDDICSSCFCCQQSSYVLPEATHGRSKDWCSDTPIAFTPASCLPMKYSDDKEEAFCNAETCSRCDQPEVDIFKQRSTNEQKFDWMSNPRPFYKKESKRSPSLSESKRDRTTFSKKQRSELERQFQLSRYPSRYHRSQIAGYLNLTEFQVKVWFQNRRMKFKRWNSAVKHANEFIPSCYCAHMLQ